MIRAAIIILATLLAAGTEANAAQRMRDMSLSVDDTMKEPDIVKEHDYLKFPGQGSSSNTARQRGTGTRLPQGGINSAPYGGDQQFGVNRFMDGYCDPNFNAGVGAGQASQGCIDNAKRQACDIFSRLPRDAQGLLDRTLSCAFSADSGGYGSYDDCAGYDSQRLQAIKAYWNDQETVYALVFLPDLVQNPAASCQQRY
jgi:hypothetical protein